jgi:signal transduction histidine kinase
MRLCIAVAAACVLAASVASPADKGSPDEAKALLAKAVALVETQGEAKALAAFNDPKGGFVDRDLYVFCFGADNKVTAHVDKSMLGVDAATLKDADGKPIGTDMVAIRAKGEGSLEYKWMNPVTKQAGPKVSYVKKAGAQLCGVGAYK